MPTAKEMFEVLGYELKPIKGTVIAYRHGIFMKDTVRFYKNRKSVSVQYAEIPLDMMKAIIQQMRELGWLDE